MVLVFAWTTTLHAQTKTALVIGIDEYHFGADLRTPAADARAVARRLSALGFDTHLSINPTQPQILTALARFRLASAEAQTTLIYVAGHGVRWRGDTYLLASDTPFADGAGLIARSIPVPVLLAATSDKVRNKIVLVDACRDLPLARSALAEMSRVPMRTRGATQAGSFVLYAAQLDGVAEDGEGAHSPFAASVLSALDRTTDLDGFARAVRAGVIARTRGAQIPWSESSMLTTLDLAHQ
ncbi:caspase family protein [Pseudaestuariivita atlantica]|uniref:Peptidase C14 caspase domain-containing protein n=1 Tax=Pseudaestuariivita atlantica TaxID=1317121 RepID=A0A0L1JQE9_9RHOB|nr:caspase family protein [Pseudaestuariivita atlantica]KNG93648.1 hypothetical protein ATO11_10615 [Pseudaestuariivita atlantica]